MHATDRIPLSPLEALAAHPPRTFQPQHPGTGFEVALQQREKRAERADSTSRLPHSRPSSTRVPEENDDVDRGVDNSLPKLPKCPPLEGTDSSAEALASERLQQRRREEADDQADEPGNTTVPIIALPPPVPTPIFQGEEPNAEDTVVIPTVASSVPAIKGAAEESSALPVVPSGENGVSSELVLPQQSSSPEIQPVTAVISTDKGNQGDKPELLAESVPLESVAGSEETSIVASDMPLLGAQNQPEPANSPESKESNAATAENASPTPELSALSTVSAVDSAESPTAENSSHDRSAKEGESEGENIAAYAPDDSGQANSPTPEPTPMATLMVPATTVSNSRTRTTASASTSESTTSAINAGQTPSRLPPQLRVHSEAARGRPVMPPSVDATRLVHRVARAFEAAQQRGGEIRLRLSPPELGSLRLQISVQDGVMVARLETETTAARATLTDNLPILRERLAEQGIRIERFEVDLMQHSSTGTPDRPADSQQHQGPEPFRPLRPLTSENKAPADHPAPPVAWNGQGRLNVIV